MATASSGSRPRTGYTHPAFLRASSPTSIRLSRRLAAHLSSSTTVALVCRSTDPQDSSSKSTLSLRKTPPSKTTSTGIARRKATQSSTSAPTAACRRTSSPDRSASPDASTPLSPTPVAMPCFCATSIGINFAMSPRCNSQWPPHLARRSSTRRELLDLCYHGRVSGRRRGSRAR